MNDFYTIEDLIKILKVSASMIRKLIREKKLEYHKVGSVYRISEAQLQKYLKDIQNG